MYNFTFLIFFCKMTSDDQTSRRKLLNYRLKKENEKCLITIYISKIGSVETIQIVLNFELFKRKNLVDLAHIIKTNYVCDWEVLPFAQKCYRLARQIFVKKICDIGHSPCLAFDYISRIKKYYKSNEMELETIIDMDFLEKIDPDYMIIE